VKRSSISVCKMRFLRKTTSRSCQKPLPHTNNAKLSRDELVGIVPRWRDAVALGHTAQSFLAGCARRQCNLGAEVTLLMCNAGSTQ